jgi:hypothetical protein
MAGARADFSAYFIVLALFAAGGREGVVECRNDRVS